MPPKDVSVSTLSLMQRLKKNWDNERDRLSLKSKELRHYVPVGGARVPAIITRVFPERPVMIKGVEKVISRGFEAFVLHTHAIEPEDSEALVGTDELTIPLRYTKKDDAPALAETIMAQKPDSTTIRSRSVLHFQTSEMDVLRTIALGQIVVLNGVRGRAVYHNGMWKKFMDVGVVEPRRGLTMASLWPAAQGTGTDFMFPNEFFYDEANSASRYNRELTYFVGLWAQAGDSDEEQEERMRRMAVECGETVLDTSRWSEDTWLTKGEENKPETRDMRASLEMLTMQWPKGIQDKYIEGETQEVLLQISLYKEGLAAFGISDPDTWVALAPLIFRYLSFKTVGYVDAKNTASGFGGVDNDKHVDFALSLTGMGIIPDLEECYRKIGVRVTADYVRDLHAHPRGACGRNLGVVTDAGELIETLAEVVPVTGGAADAGSVNTILDFKGVEYVALFEYKPTRKMLRTLPSLNTEDGSALVNAIVTRSGRELQGKPELVELFESFPESSGAVHVVVFALCSKIIPDEVRARRATDIVRYMLGKTPEGTQAIKDGSAAAEAPAPAAAAPALALAPPPPAARVDEDPDEADDPSMPDAEDQEATDEDEDEDEEEEEAAPPVAAKTADDAARFRAKPSSAKKRAAPDGARRRKPKASKPPKRAKA